MFQASEQWEIKGQALIYLQAKGACYLFLYSYFPRHLPR